MTNFLFRGFCPNENGTQEIWTDGTCQGEAIKGKVKGEWVYGNYNFYSKGNLENTDFCEHTIKSTTYPYPEYDVIPETVSQWTGLDDKNGKKLFEGDIVTCDIGNGTLPIRRLLNRTGIVKYEQHFYALEIINRFGIADDGKEDFCNKRVSFGAVNNLEVIGTIFDKEEV